MNHGLSFVLFSACVFYTQEVRSQIFVVSFTAYGSRGHWFDSRELKKVFLIRWRVLRGYKIYSQIKNACPLTTPTFTQKEQNLVRSYTRGQWLHSSPVNELWLFPRNNNLQNVSFLRYIRLPQLLPTQPY